jgi:hypothetical protein
MCLTLGGKWRGLVSASAAASPVLGDLVGPMGGTRCAHSGGLGVMVVVVVPLVCGRDSRWLPGCLAA